MIVASLAAVALPTAADAKKKPKKPYTDATFEVSSIKGSMASTWEYHRPNDKDDPCDASADGNGSQMLRFDAGGPYRVTFRKPPKSDPNLYLTEGRPFVFVGDGAGIINALSTAEREGDYTVHYNEIGPNCGDNGGADPGYVPTPKDCGTREGVLGLDLYFKEQYVDTDDLFVPLPGDKEDGQPNKLRLNDSDHHWTNPHGRSTDDLRETYENCAFYGGYPEQAGTLYITSGKLNEKQLFNRKRKRFVITGDTKRTATDGYAKTTTIMTWNIRMKRVK